MPELLEPIIKQEVVIVSGMAHGVDSLAHQLTLEQGGQTIAVTHDTDSPRPYSRNVLVQGTKGVVRKYPEEKVYLEGRSPADRWEDLAAYRDRYEHPVWRKLEEQSRGAGHGGMDYIEDYRLMAWSAVSQLSERSIAAGSAPQECPDFTRGRWRERLPLGIVGGG